MKYTSNGATTVMQQIFKPTCCVCGNEWAITCEEYVFNKVGRKVHDFSEVGIFSLEGWVCPECLDEILRIKNL